MHKPVEQFFQPFKDFKKGKESINARLKNTSLLYHASEKALYDLSALLAVGGLALGGFVLGTAVGTGFDALTQVFIPLSQTAPIEYTIIAPFVLTGIVAGARAGVELTPQAEKGRRIRRTTRHVYKQ